MPMVQSKSRRRTVVIVAVVAVAAVGGGALLLRQHRQPPPVPVAANRQVSALGRIEPETKIRKVSVSSSLSGDRIEKILVEENQEVKEGETLAVIEAMKMQNIIRAERDGVVKAVLVASGASVAADCAGAAAAAASRSYSNRLIPVIIRPFHAAIVALRA
jgi:biotin carboxyl carrier protein